MSIDDLNFLSMADVVVEILDANSDIVAKVPKLPKLKDELVQLVSTCKAQNQLLALPSGSAALKLGNREVVEKVAYTLVNTLLLFANEEHKTELAAQVNLHYADIYKSSGEKLVEQTKELIEMAIKYVHELEDYGMKQDKLEAYRKSVDEFVNLQPMPRGDISTRSAIKKQAESGIATMRSLFNDRMDRAVNIVRDDYPQFYETYYAARVIVDRHGKRRNNKPADPTKGTISGTLKDAATGDPLVNVLVRRTGQSEAITTDLNGMFVFLDVEPGKYDVLCKKDTYADLSFEAIEVTAGEEAELIGKMQKA